MQGLFVVLFFMNLKPCSRPILVDREFAHTTDLSKNNGFPAARCSVCVGGYLYLAATPAFFCLCNIPSVRLVSDSRGLIMQNHTAHFTCASIQALLLFFYLRLTHTQKITPHQQSNSLKLYALKRTAKVICASRV